MTETTERTGGLAPEPADAAAIAALVRTFFAAFTSGPECAERLDALPELFLPTALIVRTCGAEPTSYDVAGFVAPRRELLTGGAVTDFSEWVLEGRTEVFGDIAQHLCTYAKRWREGAEERSGRGMKSFLLVRTADGWRIAGAAWDDERDGVSLERVRLRS
jgi:hypothetical protein